MAARRFGLFGPSRDSSSALSAVCDVLGEDYYAYVAVSTAARSDYKQYQKEGFLPRSLRWEARHRCEYPHSRNLDEFLDKHLITPRKSRELFELLSSAALFDSSRAKALSFGDRPRFEFLLSEDEGNLAKFASAARCHLVFRRVDFALSEARSNWASLSSSRESILSGLSSERLAALELFDEARSFVATAAEAWVAAETAAREEAAESFLSSDVAAISKEVAALRESAAGDPLAEARLEGFTRGAEAFTRVSRRRRSM